MRGFLMMNSQIKSYSDLIIYPSFEERFNYLKLSGSVGEDTFGHDRYLNQFFYQHDAEWKRARNYVILRDSGCDLGILEREIPQGVRIIIHHMNPITPTDILYRSDILLNPDFLITTTDRTHRALHYGSLDYAKGLDFVERSPNDTCPWRK